VISGQSMPPKRDALSVSERAYGYDDDAPTLSRRISYRVLLTTTSGRLGIKPSIGDVSAVLVRPFAGQFLKVVAMWGGSMTDLSCPARANSAATRPPAWCRDRR
jgi:hypothetical protein